jgi:hypothetical protein
MALVCALRPTRARRAFAIARALDELLQPCAPPPLGVVHWLRACPDGCWPVRPRLCRRVWPWDDSGPPLHHLAIGTPQRCRPWSCWAEGPARRRTARPRPRGSAATTARCHGSSPSASHAAAQTAAGSARCLGGVPAAPTCTASLPCRVFCGLRLKPGTERLTGAHPAARHNSGREWAIPRRSVAGTATLGHRRLVLGWCASPSGSSFPLARLMRQ